MRTYPKEVLGRIIELKKLTYAHQAMAVCAKSCELALANESEMEYLSHIYSIAVCVSYASPFLSSNGLPPLGGSFSKFSNEEDLQRHKELIELRHMLYAHKDVENAKHYEQGELISSHEIYLDFLQGGRFEIGTYNVRLARRTFVDTLRLVKYQMSRLEEKTGKVMRHLRKGGKPLIGRFVLGESFP